MMSCSLTKIGLSMGNRIVLSIKEPLCQLVKETAMSVFTLHLLGAASKTLQSDGSISCQN